MHRICDFACFLLQNLHFCLAQLRPVSAILTPIFRFSENPVYRHFLSISRNLIEFCYGGFSVSFHFCVVSGNRVLIFDTFVSKSRLSSVVRGDVGPSTPRNDSGIALFSGHFASNFALSVHFRYGLIDPASKNDHIHSPQFRCPVSPPKSPF